MSGSKFTVAVVGAGIAGLFMADKLKRAGIHFTVYEKSSDIGGGASGIQITEALAWEDCEVTQFIRRAQWVHIRDNPRSTLWERLLLRLPFMYQRHQRQLWRLINEGDRWRLKPGPAREAME